MMSFLQIVDHGIGSGFRVFVRNQLGKFRRGVENHPGILFERTKRFAPFGRLIDMPRHGNGTVGCLLILAELPLAGQTHGTHLNRTSILDNSSEHGLNSTKSAYSIYRAVSTSF